MGRRMFGRHLVQRNRTPKSRLQVVLLEARNLPSGLVLTPLVQVSGASPLEPPPPSPTVFYNSELEPQIAVDPTDPFHIVGVWQQDRYSGSGARALVAGLSSDGGNTWDVAPIPWFDSTDPLGHAYERYTDPWVSIAPNGDVYVTALALTITGGFPTPSAVLATKSTDGGETWLPPVTLAATQAPPGSNPGELQHDKEAVTADPNDPTGRTAYVIWDRYNQPSDESGFNAFHSFAFRADTLFSRTTDGGKTWETRVIVAPQANEQWFGHQIVVLPTTSNHPGRLVDVFALLLGSGKQGVKAARDKVAVMYSDDQGETWSQPIIVADAFDLEVSDPDTGAPVRVGEPIPDIAVDPNNGNLYAVWLDARFSNYKADGVAMSMSTDGGLTWSRPIKVNQTPTDIPVQNQQAFTPSVAVAANGTVAVTYYDFRNNTSASGLLTDYWLVHADSDFANPASWSDDVKRLTDGSFNMEEAAVARGYFLGDYEGLAAGGEHFNSFYALFGVAKLEDNRPASNIFFRDPPPVTDFAAENPAPTEVPPPFAAVAVDSTLLASRVLNGSAAWGLAPGFPDWIGPTRLLRTVAGENRTPTPAPAGLDIVAVDQTFAAGVRDAKGVLIGPSRTTSKSRDVPDDWPTDDRSLDTAFPETGFRG